jgi:hypothetical protein
MYRIYNMYGMMCVFMFQGVEIPIGDIHSASSPCMSPVIYSFFFFF